MGPGTSGPALCFLEMRLSALACRVALGAQLFTLPIVSVCGERRTGEGRCSADGHPAPRMALGTVLPSQEPRRPPGPPAFLCGCLGTQPLGPRDGKDVCETARRGEGLRDKLAPGCHSACLLQGTGRSDKTRGSNFGYEQHTHRRNSASSGH